MISIFNIFTIGHSNYSLDKFIDMLRYFNIDCVVDIRGIPYSKYNIQYNKENLRYSLMKEGFIYIYMAKEFAANRENKYSYNKEGYSDFEKVIKEKEFIYGIERLRNGCRKGYKIALLGAMQDPIRCHRSILVGRNLIQAGFNVNHILDDYSIIYQKDIENRLLDKYFYNRNQISIDEIMGNNISNEELVIEGYRLANKEIGYRVENIKERGE